MVSFTDCYDKFEKMELFVFSDLENATTKAHANFLVAMALFNYIETLGSFCFPCQEKDIEAKRFNFVFTDLLPKVYEEVFIRIRDAVAKPYALLRCGMTHGYLPVTVVAKNNNIEVSYIIRGVRDENEYADVIQNEQCGIKIHVDEFGKYTIEILIPRFIHDFKVAFNSLKEKINSDDEFKAKFIIRASDLQLYSLG